MKIVIAGCRHITNPNYLKILFNEYFNEWNGEPVTEVVSGGAKGVDFLGEQWAKKQNIPIKLFKADWTSHGVAAGPIRNQRMALYADCALIIWDWKSKGTKNMIESMQKLNKPCYVFIPPEFESNAPDMPFLFEC